MFDINFNHLVDSQLPADKRTAFNLKLHLWWLRMVDKLHDSARKFGLTQFQRATTTAQIGSLVQTLNDIFNPSVSIYITDVEWLDDPYVYLDAEPYQDVTLYLDAEIIAEDQEVFLWTDIEANPTQFIIWIPADLWFPEIIEQIRAVAEQHVLAGKYFTIQQIP